jgi:hypothetical protein
MTAPHLITLILGTAGLILMLIQTARAAYWRGAHEEQRLRCQHLCEQIDETRKQRDAARTDAADGLLYTREICERLMLAAHAPEAYDEIINANQLLRSLHAVVKREGSDTNWEPLQDRIEERLNAQHRMLHNTDSYSPTDH